MKSIGLIAFILVVVGGLNWGLIGFFKFNLVAAIFGDMSMVSRLIYALVGLATLSKVAMFKKHCCKGEQK